MLSFVNNSSLAVVRLFGQMKREKIFPVVIIGAGPAGLSAAYELALQNIKTLVLEKDPKYVGGLAKTLNYKGFRFDIGGHRFFSKNKEIENLWNKILGRDLLLKKRLSRIFYRKKFFHYPLQPLNALVNLGFLTAIGVFASYVLARVFPIKNEHSFEDWVVNRFGRRLYTIFFKTYTEKVWGIPCNKISKDWAAQRIRDLSLKELILNAFLGRKKHGEVVKTLTDRFKYPKLGPGMFWWKVKEIIEDHSSSVLLGSPAVSVLHNGKKITSVIVEREGSKINILGDHFISSMPLVELINCLNPKPPSRVLHVAQNLKYRDFLLVVVVIAKKNLFPDQWIYIHDPNVRVGRIQNFKNWSDLMVPKSDLTCLGLEYFCSKKDELWNKADDKIIEIAVKELEFLGFINKTEVLSRKVIRVTEAYPVYDRGYLSKVQIIRKYLQNFTNLQVVGRNGMHKYNNQDHAMMTGLLATRNIMGGKFDLWRVTSDAVYGDERGKGVTVGERLTPKRLG